MRRGLLHAVAIALTAVRGGAAAAPDVVVSPEGPVRTLDEARKTVRALPGFRKRPVTVLIRGGMYRLAAPVEFGPEDSGAPRAPVIYEAWPGERPVFSGGDRIAGWTAGAGGRWTVRLPEAAGARWRFAQLWVNGERRYRPRWPKEGYVYVASGLAASEANRGKGWDRLRMFPADLPAELKAGEVEVLAFHLWHMNRHRLAAVDRGTGTLTFTGPTALRDDWANYRRGDRVIFENIHEMLAAPGEWFLDTADGTLAYLPRPGESPETAEVVAPRLTRLLVLRGDLAGRRFVHDLEFRGLAFRHAHWAVPAEGYACAQAEAALGGAVEAVAARKVSFRGCEVSAVGEYAFEARDGSREIALEGCALSDLGAGGVKIGNFEWGEDRRKDPEAPTGWITVRDCAIVSGGRMHPAACGVLIGHSPHNTIERNEIRDFYYTGVSVGWSWGYADSAAHHNLLRGNHVHRLGQAVLSDMGGVYTLGISPGTRVEGNAFHDITSFEYGGWGIYFDEGSTGIVAEGNWAFRCSSAGFHQHYGRDNVVQRNVFALNRDGQLMRTRSEAHRSFTFERNAVLTDASPLLVSDWSGTGFAMDRNLYWSRSGPLAGPIRDVPWAAWKALGFDRHSVVADPGFRDPARGDFRAKPGSPAANLGFADLDLRAAGPKPAKRGEWRAPAPPDAAPAYPPGAPAVLPVAEDCEGTKPGEKIPDAGTYEDEGATARVTEENAATGRRSLAFVKAPVQPQPHDWNPHVHWSPAYESGELRGGFALRLARGASFSHEWRDTKTPGAGGWYSPGVSLSIGADGVLKANGTAIASIPPDQWARVEVRCAVGKGATGAYRLRLSLPGGNVVERADLASPPLARVTWWGFTAPGPRPGPAFFLDEISLGPATP